MMDAAPAATDAAPARRGSLWINGRGWDLTWLLGTAVVVPVGLFFVWAGASSDAVNLVVTALVGAPHVFSTFLTTYLDPRFRRRHAAILLAAALVIPTGVVFMIAAHFQALLSFFVFAASLHVVHQNAYLADVYRRRMGRVEPAASRWLDYGVLGLSFYPIASYKLVRDEFLLGDVTILIPSVVKLEATPWVVSSAFAAVLTAWIGKCLWERARGVLNAPKTALIGLTALIAFSVPAAASGARLELAFQTVNMWHSVQYLAITWLVLKVRRERGCALSPFVARLSGPGRPTLYYYGLCLALTMALFGVIVLLCRARPGALSNAQYYYMVVFSVLFIHYFLDGYFFLASNRGEARPDELPLAAPARA